MQEIINAVKHFHDAFGQHYASEPSLIKEKEYQLRHDLQAEELFEYLLACRESDLVGIADALGDQLYILVGTILKHGMQDKIVEVFEEIQRSNMSKLGEDGLPILREDGKILKGPNYSKPNIKSILEQKK
jgi:predicted HAD superfamily Cof-like phosphohydrolase